MPSKKQRSNERKNKKQAEEAENAKNMRNLTRVFEEGGMDCCVCYDKAVYFDSNRDDPFVHYGVACANAWHVVCYKCWILDPNTFPSESDPSWVCPMCKEKQCMTRLTAIIPNGIEEEGGVCTDEKPPYYMKRGEKVVIDN